MVFGLADSGGSDDLIVGIPRRYFIRYRISEPAFNREQYKEWKESNEDNNFAYIFDYFKYCL